MYLYTETHITMVFLMGLINGIVGTFVVLELRSGYKVTKLILRMALRPILRQMKKRNGVNKKIPTARTVSTFNH